jgi:uncharacterized protein YdaU (DUF1376 family)
MMTPAERAGYLDLLCYQWGDPTCSLPADPALLARMSGLDEAAFKGTSSILAIRFPKHPKLKDRVANPKLLEIRAEVERKAEASSRGGKRSQEVQRQQREGGTEDPLKSTSKSTSKSTCNDTSKYSNSKSKSKSKSKPEPKPEPEKIDHLDLSSLKETCATVNVAQWVDAADFARRTFWDKDVDRRAPIPKPNAKDRVFWLRVAMLAELDPTVAAEVRSAVTAIQMRSAGPPRSPIKFFRTTIQDKVDGFEDRLKLVPHPPENSP